MKFSKNSYLSELYSEKGSLLGKIVKNETYVYAYVYSLRDHYNHQLKIKCNTVYLEFHSILVIPSFIKSPIDFMHSTKT